MSVLVIIILGVCKQKCVLKVSSVDVGQFRIEWKNGNFYLPCLVLKTVGKGKAISLQAWTGL